MNKSNDGIPLGKKKGIHIPNTPALLLIVALIVAVLTYIIPAGTFERQFDEANNRTLVVAGTYEQVEQTPVGIGDLFSAFFNGTVEAGELIAFLFATGGAFYVVQKSGAINAGLGKLIKRFKGREFWLIAILMTLFSVGGATFGMAEEVLPFIVILTAAATAMGFDSVVGVSIVLIGVYCGYSAGPLNPFNTGIAQGICELPTFSGLGLRVVLMVGALAIAIIHTIRYCIKLRKSKAAAVVDEKELLEQAAHAEAFELEFTVQRKIILSILGLTIVALVFGVMKFGWYFAEISALFMGMSLIVGMIMHKGKFEDWALDFIEGAKEMAGTAILMGMSRMILVIATEGQIMDTIIYALSVPLSKVSGVLAAWGMYIAQGFINFLIPSSSGQAVAVMPIMSGLSDLIGVSRQTAVIAFEAGDGFWNMITPTHTVVMAALGLAKLDFKKWFKFALPLVALWSIWICIVLAYAVLSGYGPF